MFIVVVLAFAITLVASLFVSPAQAEQRTKDIISLHTEALQERESVDLVIVQKIDDLQPLQDEIDVLEDSYVALTDELMGYQQTLASQCFFWDEVEQDFYEDQAGCHTWDEFSEGEAEYDDGSYF